jgi:hypothetical protein
MSRFFDRRVRAVRNRFSPLVMAFFHLYSR